MDKLEKYVREHREEFDRAIPDLRVWGELAAELDRPVPVRHLPWYRRPRLLAAAAALVLAGAMGVYWCQVPATITEYPATNGRPIAATEDLPEWERQYQRQFAEGYAQLASLQPEPAVQRDLQQMDAVLEELRAELADAPVGAREAIVEAMIQHYQTKLELLEYILTQLRAATPTDLNEANDETSI